MPPASDGLVQPPPAGVNLNPHTPPPTSFYQRHRSAVLGGGAFFVLVVGYLLYRQHNSNNNQATTATSSGSANPSGFDTSQLGQYPDMGGYGGTATGQTLASQIASQEQGIAANTQAIQSGDAAINHQLVDLNHSQATQTNQLTNIQSGVNTVKAQTSPNPYPVGTHNARTGETVVTSLWDPLENSWISETDKGGVWTSRGLGLSGSAIGKGTFKPGSLQLVDGGKQFVETNSAGQKFEYSIL